MGAKFWYPYVSYTHTTFLIWVPSYSRNYTVFVRSGLYNEECLMPQGWGRGLAVGCKVLMQLGVLLLTDRFVTRALTV